MANPTCAHVATHRLSDRPAKSQGLGDTIAKLTDKLGIKKCGKCKKRQEAINKIIPYKK